jgi:hypothetical protein
MIVGLENNYYVIFRRLSCKSKGCSTYSELSDDVLSQLPTHFQMALPFVLSHRKGLDKSIVRLMTSFIFEGGSIASMEKILKEFHVLSYDNRHLSYLYSIEHSRSDQRQPKQFFNRMKGHMDVHETQVFSTYVDSSGYCGSSPSKHFLSSMYVKSTSERSKHLDQRVSMLDARVLKGMYAFLLITLYTNHEHVGDHSFKIINHLGKVHRQNVFNALYTVTNEKEQIICHALTPTKGHDYVKQILQSRKRTVDLLGHHEPLVFFTDNAKQDRNMIEHVFPSLKCTSASTNHNIAMSHLNIKEMPQKIQLLETRAGAETFLEHVIDEAEASKDGVYVGFDCEWDYNPHTHVPGKVALVQVATDTQVGLIHLTKTGVPKRLAVFLNSSKIYKVGKHVGGDIKRIIKDFNLNISPGGFEG